MPFAHVTATETPLALNQRAAMQPAQRGKVRQGLVIAGMVITGAVLYLLLAQEAFWDVCRLYLRAAHLGGFMPHALRTVPGTGTQIGLTIGGGAAMGFFVGLAVTFKRRNEAALRLGAAEIMRLAPLPLFGALPTHLRRKPESGVFMDRPQDPFTESMRAVRDNIYRAHGNGECCVILVTSASVSDGKTEIALNLARSLADDGKAAILVDADLRRGPETKLFRTNFFDESAAARHTIAIMAPETGGTTGLADWVATSRIPHFDRYPKQAFHMLPSGPTPPNPAELMNHPSFADVFDTLRQEFDFVVIDSPALPMVADGLKLARLADIVLSVVRPHHTMREDFVTHHDMLGRLGKRRGLILNDIARPTDTPLPVVDTAEKLEMPAEAETIC